MKKFHFTNLRWLAISLVVIFIDQLTKYFARQHLGYNEPVNIFPGFNLLLLHNTGAAFSFLAEASGWQRWFFTGVALVVCLVLIYYLLKAKSSSYYYLAAWSLIIGGAISNVVDRLQVAYVTDFLDFYVSSYHWPAFNIADSAIVVGVFLLIITSSKSHE